MDDIITKRLHISGLTPAISAADISQRLSTFGTVKSVEGVGLKDGLGQHRKFGYVTIEATPAKLARCFNLLSGSTWKGTKLRIGEAKPDFAERLAREREEEEPPKKKRKHFGGVLAEDMSLVTPENAVSRGGWKVTPLGRIIRPIRMRPERPLPPVLDKPKPGTKKASEPVRKRKRVKVPDTRARRRTIDMTKFGSVLLKGKFLELDVPITRKSELDREEAAEEIENDSSSNDEDSDEEERPLIADTSDRNPISPAPAVEKAPPPLPLPADVASSPAKLPVSSVPQKAPVAQPIPPKDTTILPDDNVDIALEKSKSLNLLASLFGKNDGEEDWIGRESVGSDIDEDELTKGDAMLVDGAEVDFEIVPAEPSLPTRDQEQDEDDEDGDDTNMQVEEASAENSKQPSPPANETTRTSLKDLFAPREEESGFSLLGHLDLDLELDDEFAYPSEERAAAVDYTHTYQAPAPTVGITAPLKSQLDHQPPITLNPKQALFFPVSFPLSEDAAFNTKARPKDIFDLAKENGWDWRDPKVGFYRTETEEEIRKKWEAEKGELTREWKRRCRDAIKVSRRRGKGTGEDGGD